MIDEALTERCVGGDVFGLQLDLFVEVGGADDVGAGPCELKESIGLAFADGGGEVEVDAGGGDLGWGLGEVEDGHVEVAVVAVGGDQVSRWLVGGICSKGLPVWSLITLFELRAAWLVRGLDEGEGVDADFGGLDCEGDGGWRGAGLGVAGHGHDVGGDSFFGNHGLEGGGDGVLKIAGDGDDADVERDAGLQGGVEFGGRPPDEIGEAGWQQVVGGIGFRM